MARLEGAYEQASQRLTNIDQRFDAIDRRFDGVDRKIDLLRDSLDKKIDALDTKIDKSFRWTIGVGVTAWVTTIASVFLHH